MLCCRLIYNYVIHDICWTYDQSKGGDTRELKSRIVPHKITGSSHLKKQPLEGVDVVSVFVMQFRALIEVSWFHFVSFIRNAKVGDWVLFSRSVSFDGPFFMLKSGGVTECKLRGRRKKGGVVGGWYSPIKVMGVLVRKFCERLLKGTRILFYGLVCCR